MKMILSNIEKSFTAPVIKGISYTFEPGKLYVIKGVSGCGKTTLMNIIGGIDSEYSGSIECEGEYTAGYIFQSSLLLSDITVMENLLLIKNDPEKIRSLCSFLKIEPLLEKFPEQLSGGERQRVSVVRALLHDPCLLLADEPTASLDEANSKSIAELISSLKNEGRIVIVSTHEECFDSFADEIIHLDYGIIGEVEKKSPRIAKSEAGKGGENKRAKSFGAFELAWKRRKKLLSFGSLFPLVLAFLLVTVISTAQNNFEVEYRRLLGDKYPMDMLVLNSQEYDAFKYKDELVLYENYIASEGEVNAFHLLPENASVFMIDGMIEFGEFPENDSEILVSPDFVKTAFGDERELSSVIGEGVTFKGHQYKISGVICDIYAEENEEESKNLHSYSYYHICYRRPVKNAIFVMYDSIKEYGDINPNDGYTGIIVAVYDDVLGTPEVYEALLDCMMYEGMPNQFYANIKNTQSSIDDITSLFVLILGVCFFTSCIFMISVITTGLYYRRREFGYLQIFGLSKQRITSVILGEYFLKIAASLVMSAAVYFASLTVYALAFGRFIICEPVFALAITAVLVSVYMLTVFITAKVFLRRSVLSMITR